MEYKPATAPRAPEYCLRFRGADSVVIEDAEGIFREAIEVCSFVNEGWIHVRREDQRM